jgi:hypothetical protein
MQVEFAVRERGHPERRDGLAGREHEEIIFA